VTEWAGAAVLFQPAGEGGAAGSLIIMAAFIGIFYFLLIRPQRVQQRKHEEFVKGLRRGDEVATVGGLIGEIVHLKDDRVTLKTADDTRVTVERDKVLRRVGGGAEPAETS
jgi:preprotein translocase subunit YajC